MEKQSYTQDNPLRSYNDLIYFLKRDALELGKIINSKVRIEVHVNPKTSSVQVHINQDIV